ncbi:MAG: CaiB/BaiF CoA transferase family protein [Ilumatobacter sp.]
MKPLDGIRVVEFSTMITAAFAAMMLAEQGAEVIKVEPIDIGDPMRYLGSSKGGCSALFANCNRGKRSLRLDIKSDEGRTAIEALARESDVVLCNFRPGVMDGLGLGSEQLRAINPRLIYAAVSGFGTEGPQRDAPAYDPIIQAQAGFAAVQSAGKKRPEFMQTLMCDKVTAYTTCQAVTAALFAREKTGEGQSIDVSMMDAGLYFLFPDGFMHHTLLDADAHHQPPLGDRIFQLSATRDGAVTISAGTSAHQVGLLTAVERLDVLDDERFSSVEQLRRNAGAFREELEAAIAGFDTDDLLARLHANGVPAAQPLTHHEAIGHPQYAANDSVDVDTHPRLGSMRRVKPPARFEGDRLDPASHSPAHGEHTVEVLRELGHSDDEIRAFIDRGIARSAG